MREQNQRVSNYDLQTNYGRRNVTSVKDTIVREDFLEGMVHGIY